MNFLKHFTNTSLRATNGSAAIYFSGLLRRFTPRNDKADNNTQRGSVFVYILLAVALLAALSYAVSRGNRNSTSTMTDQQAKLAAQEIIEYGNTVAAAVQKLRLRGCLDTEISFENSTYAGYINPNAPSDKSCHVFDLNGGNIEYAKSPDPYFFLSNPVWRQSYGFMIGTEWEGNGNTCASNECVDLMMLLSPLDENICSAINKVLGISTIPEDTQLSGAPFQGAYAYSKTIGDEAAGTAMIGKTAACFKNLSPADYRFTQVLIAR